VPGGTGFDARVPAHEYREDDEQGGGDGKFQRVCVPAGDRPDEKASRNEKAGKPKR